MSDIDMDAVRRHLGCIASAEHMGDVNNDLPELCKALGLPVPWWIEEGDRFIMDWEVDQYISDIEGDGITRTLIRGDYGSPDYEVRYIP